MKQKSNRFNNRFRHELKYFIHCSEYEGLRNRLKNMLDYDSFSDSDGGYHVRSLYFDDVYDSALYDKSFGVLKRKKYRIRIYNKSDSVIRLERKTKYDQYILKETELMSKDEYYKILNSDADFLINKESELYKQFYTEIKYNLLKPKVIVDYEREAYVFKFSNVRITFDKGLCAGINSCDIFDKNLVTVNAFKEPIMILEIKYNDFLADNVRTLLQISSHERSAISKYQICRVIKAGRQLV